MDLQLYIRVLWRFRRIVIAGFLLAVGLMIFSMFNVSFGGGTPKLTYREAETWRSDATLFVTQEGFPWGRIRVGEEAVSVDRAGEPTEPKFAAPERFADLAVVYSELAQSDAIRKLMLEQGPIRGQILAEPMTSEDGDGLPMFGITALSGTAAGAVELSRRQIEAFQAYIAEEQARNEVPDDEKVEVMALAQPRNAVLEVPRKKTRPFAIFMAVMIATIGLAFVLENMRPRIRAVPPGAVQPPPQVARRSAEQPPHVARRSA